MAHFEYPYLIVLHPQLMSSANRRLVICTSFAYTNRSIIFFQSSYIILFEKNVEEGG